MRRHPLGVSQCEDDRSVQPARTAEVEVLDRRVDAELGRPEVPLQAAVVAVLGLPVDEHPQALLEGEGLVVGAFELLREGAGHAREVERVELLEGRVGEHRRVLLHS